MELAIKAFWIVFGVLAGGTVFIFLLAAIGFVIGLIRKLIKEAGRAQLGS